MSIVSKLAKSGAAKKLIDQAKKPENQAKAKDLLNKVKDKRRPAGQPAGSRRRLRHRPRGRRRRAPPCR